MSTPVDTIELQIARILSILDKQCERFHVDPKSEPKPRPKEVAAAENSEANGDSRKTTQS